MLRIAIENINLSGEEKYKKFGFVLVRLSFRLSIDSFVSYIYRTRQAQDMKGIESCPREY